MEGDIKRKELWRGLNNVRQTDWVKAADELKLLLVGPTGGTSHYVSIRDPKKPDRNDPTGVITTLTPNCFKQANEKIFKKILRYGKNNGITEDDIWKALGKL